VNGILPSLHEQSLEITLTVHSPLNHTFSLTIALQITAAHTKSLVLGGPFKRPLGRR